MRNRKKLDQMAESVLEDRTESQGAGWGDLARFVATARTQLPAQPDDRTEAQHLAAIREAVVEDRTQPSARSLLIPRRRTSLLDRTKPLMARLALAVATLTGGTAGLAYAGVDLPGQAAERAFEAVGVELPNQSTEEPAEEGSLATESAKNEGVGAQQNGGKSVSEAVLELIRNWQGERGCEFGQAVSEVASQNSQGDPQGPGQEKDPCTQEIEVEVEAQGGSETGAGKSAEGKAKADENKSDAGSSGREKSAEGKAKADENKSDAGSSGQEKSAEGKAKADERRGGPEEEDG
jgi:hypothetical protein